MSGKRGTPRIERARTMRPVYAAIAVRSGGWWALEVPELPGVFTQTRRLDLAERAVRDAIAVFLGAAPDSFDVEVLPRLSPEFVERLEEARRLRREAELAGQAASEATRRLVQELLDGGLTVRDAGTMLGVSHQRVAQLDGSRRATR